MDAAGTQIITDEVLLQGHFGRLRDVTEAVDGVLLVSTDNGDDVVLRVSLGG